ncbi:PTS sugar transporter subunit IIB [Staphylococcus pseudoxylosus]|uniref:PTS sugar transporter subunit IIB n=1 Tax=Staphylococcus pseudoxylosus TaxID=2282419 RepID=A0AAQ0MGC2_9STAP|nr:PTS sugar transporter subunit IIB [Staphylococcus pseudoxylosus]MCE5003664.1 PTS sugar transporter subunit IIB [Staphylococcus pseudoxylosus]RMI83883.1 PTS sugar transporter subunit IIB [Staphylococcus pseudoxylosus]
MSKKIIFACSSGIATSTVVAEKVTNHCKENGINVDARQAILSELPSLDDSADLIVVTSQSEAQLNTKVVNAMPVVTGIGEEQVLNEIVEHLKGE